MNALVYLFLWTMFFSALFKVKYLAFTKTFLQQNVKILSREKS